MGESFTERDEKGAWIHCAPSKERVTAMLVSGLGSKTVVTRTDAADLPRWPGGAQGT
jgi:hypothetical protein